MTKCASHPLVFSIASILHRRKTLFITYHGVSRDSEEFEAWTMVREGEFRRQMAFLKDHFECLPIEKVLNQNGGLGNRPGVVVTFDDGYANNLELALPILEESGIPATIYVTTWHVCERRLFWPDKIWMAAKRSKVSRIDLTGIADSLRYYSLHGTGKQWQDGVLEILEDVKRTDPSSREECVEQIVTRFQESSEAGPFEIEIEGNPFTPLTSDQISELAAHPLITIGAHSHCHSLLDQIPLSLARKSITRSKDILTRITGREVKHFSYPNGNFNLDIVKIIQKAGFSSAVTLQPGYYKKGDNPHLISRYIVWTHMSFQLFKAKLTGAFELGRKISRPFSENRRRHEIQPKEHESQEMPIW